MTPPSFNISERYELGGDSWSWRLKDNQIRFRGTGKYTNLVSQRIPASDSQIESVHEAFNLLDVWQWRDDYDPHDAEREVLDGCSWTFDAQFGGHINHSAGSNAYPSFADPLKTSLSRDRFDLLITAIYSAFRIDYYIDQARQYSNPLVHKDG
ncbi:MAG: hypothetical protein R3C59_27430 [Planctomycetaceae bacterium]